MTTADHTNLWFENSLDFSYKWTSFRRFITILSLIISASVIIHSFWQHKLCYSSIRILTEVAAITLFITTVFQLYSFEAGNDIQHKILVNIFVYSIFRPICQICDNYIIYSMMIFMDNLQTHQQIYIIIMIFFLISTYIPFTTVLPLALDMNSDLMMVIRQVMSCYVYAASSFLFYITFIIKLRRLLASQSNLELSTRNLLHVVVSCIGVLLVSIEVVYPQLFPAGILIQMLGIVLSLHILFNSQKPRTLPPGGKTMLTTTKQNPAYFKFAKIAPVFWPRPLNHAEASSDGYGYNVPNHNIDDAFVAIVQQGSSNQMKYPDTGPSTSPVACPRPAYLSMTLI